MSRPSYPTYPQQHPHHGRPFIEVHNHDILCGRGVNIASHPGNERFRALVQSRHDANYCTAYTTSEKRAVAEEILRHIKKLTPPGRFLKRIGRAPVSRGLQGPWEELTDRESIKKTCQALRDCNRTDRTGYAAAVSVPEDVKMHAQSRSRSGLSNKEQAAAAAAAKIRTEGGPPAAGMPMHHQQPNHSGAMRMAPGPVPMPYHSGMPGGAPLPMHIPMPPPSMGIAGAPMPIRPDLSSTSSHNYAPNPMPQAPPPPHHHLHHHHPPPPHSLHPMHHHHQHPAHHQHARAPPPGHAPHPEYSTNAHSHSHHHPPPPPPTRQEKPSPPGHLQTHPAHQPQPLVVHHHAPPPPPPTHSSEPYYAHQEHRRSSHSSDASSKRSRSTYEDDRTVSPAENAAEWLKKQKSVDTRPSATAPPASTAATITPTDPVGPGFLHDGFHDIGQTPSQETTTTSGTTPTSEATNPLSRAHRPSLSPASAMPPSPSLAYNPHHLGPPNPTLYSHHHHEYIAPTPTAAEHPYAFHYAHDQTGAPSSDPKHAYNGSAADAAAAHLDQQQLQAAAEDAAAALPGAGNHHGSDFATSSPGSYHHEDPAYQLM